jgi:DNA repair photolyase
MEKNFEKHSPRGRGSTINPSGRFERLAYDDADPDVVQPDEFADDEPARARTEYFRDSSASIVARNTSPDVGFDASINPYRGCEHGCVYCYARPTHEFLGLSAGLDFETKIFVKEKAPELLRAKLMSRAWQPTPLALSGVTDPYQPIERRLQLTRRCLEVLAEFRNPVIVITKNHLVTRDVDLLAALAQDQAASVFVSVTTLDASLARTMEPRTSSPERRLDAIAALARAGVPTGVLVAPVVPALTDSEIPRILEAAANAGATAAGHVVLRLPHGVKSIFEQWLDAHYPDRKEKILARVRALRGGELYRARFGERMSGTGIFAEQIHAMFEASRKRFGLASRGHAPSTAAFRRAATSRPQGDLFE